MDVDGLQTSQGSQNDAVGERVCAGVFDVTPDSCVSHTHSREVEDFSGKKYTCGLKHGCVDICISIHTSCQRKDSIRSLFSENGEATV